MDDRIIKARIDAIRLRAVRRTGPIGGWIASTAIHTAPGAYRDGDTWRELSEGETWPAGRTLFLRTRASFPNPAPDETCLLAFDLRLMEGLLSVDGEPYCGVDREHTSVPFDLTGQRELSVEFLCVPDSFHTAAARAERAELRGVRWDIVHRDSLALAWDVQFAWEAARAVTDARRRALISSAVERALIAIDLRAERIPFETSVAVAREILRCLVGSIGGDPEEGKIFLTGHSHIDTAWLWPLRETVRKCGRTFATACRLLEAYPAYSFSCSQPQLYTYTKEHFPGLYERIRAWVKAGRWECTGGMWVESDCNVPSGESLIRQLLHGISFFASEFGVRPRTCWLPDVFGYPASLPGILAGCGITGFYTNKLHWQARNTFPTHLFHWEGIDGSSLLAHIPRLKEYYNGSPTPEQLRAAWDGFSEKAAHQEVLVPFGFGDGGGGPTVAMLEFADRARSFPGLPAARQGPEERYFDDVRRAGPELPTWVGELYLETHRGTYTTQSRIKGANRRNEILLGEAEVLSSIADMDRGVASPAVWRSLREAWETLLLLQFHDILPGSSIGEVYTDAGERHLAVEAAARSARDGALASLLPGGPKGSLWIVNALSWERSDPVEALVPGSAAQFDVTLNGQTVIGQAVERADDSTRIVFVPPRVPGVGYARAAVAPSAHPSPSVFRVEGSGIESPLYRLALAPDGSLTRLYDVAAGREVLAPGENANRLLLFQDGPEIEAAWNIHPVFEKREYAWDGETHVEVVEQGPVRLVVRTRHRRGATTIVQDMILWAGHPRIDWVTRADWHERQTLLKAAFPVAVRSDHATYEVQFGAVQRPTHRNTSWDQEKFEVCAHRWMDLSEPGYGISLLNDSRYGCDVHGHTMRLTLLRGAEWPDPEADQGAHEMVYSLLPHRADWVSAGTVRRAAELNAPMTVRGPGTAHGNGGTARAFMTVEGAGILSGVKRAEDGDGWILRVYEPHGARGTAIVTAPRDIASLAECNHVEEGEESLRTRGASFSAALLPFQVRTFRLRF